MKRTAALGLLASLLLALAGGVTLNVTGGR